MNVSKLLYLFLISFLIYSCSDDDSDAPNGNPPEEASNYFPLVIGNFWDYENVVISPEQGDLVSDETLSLVNSTGGNFEFETDNPMNAGPMTSALSQGVLNKSGNQLIFTGALGFAVEGFPALNIGLDNAAIYDLDVSLGDVMFSDSGSFQETIEGIPLTFNYEIETIMGESISAYPVNGTSYTDVISSQMVVTLEIKASLFIEVTVLPEQEVVTIDNYFAKDIGMVYSETDVNLDFIELDQIQIPIQDVEFDVTQSLESYSVELD